MVPKAGSEFHCKENMNNRRKIEPPGVTIQESIHFLKMTPTEFARRLDVNESFLNRLIAGEEPITSSLSERLEALTGSPSNFWKMLESKYRRSL